MSGAIIRLSVVDSTNVYAAKLLGQSVIKEWTTVVTDSQSAGRGQRGRVWDSGFGKNLLCSTIVKPTHLRVQEQFIVSAAACVGVCLALLDFGLEAQVKWPNDILIGSKKTAGLLIENQLAKDHIENSIVGLGLNVNQRDFNAYSWPATSMLGELGRETDRDEVLHRFRDHFKAMYELGKTSKVTLLGHYNDLLYARGSKIELQSSEGSITGTLKGVTLLGEIVLDTATGEKRFVNGEVRLSRISS